MTDTSEGVIGGTDAAATCLAQGWGVGTLLAGDDGYGETVLRLTAMGESIVVARCVCLQGRRVERPEAAWSLQYRPWREVSQEYLDSLPELEEDGQMRLFGDADDA